MSHKDPQVLKGRPKSPHELFNYVNSTSQNNSPIKSKTFFGGSPQTNRMTKSGDGFFLGGTGPEVTLFEEGKRDCKKKKELIIV